MSFPVDLVPNGVPCSGGNRIGRRTTVDGVQECVGVGVGVGEWMCVDGGLEG